jgi:hypothetical protein
MSNLKVNTINDASGGSNAVLYGVAAPANSMGFRNRILNGGMVIDQRNAGASVNNTAAGVGTYTLDRWLSYGTAATKFSVQQNAGAVTPPAGYSNYLGVTSASAYAVPAGELYYITQRVEGFNSADLAWGTASAASVTVSFWVRSSLTGTFGGAVNNGAGNRSYPFNYSVSAANTWEQKTITIPGDTAGTWLTNNGIGLQVVFSLGIGSTFSGAAGSWSGSTFLSATGATSVVGTSGATFYITGVQLEAGSVASPFERRDYGRELIMCQRYYSVIQVGAYGFPCPSTGGFAYVQRYDLPQTMRVAPTMSKTYSSMFNVSTVNVTTITSDFIADQIVGTGLANVTWLFSATASAEL